MVKFDFEFYPTESIQSANCYLSTFY